MTTPANTANQHHNRRPARPQVQAIPMNSQAIISLGTLVMAFVAKPLAGLTDPITGQKKFQEVQVYFYNFNNKAGMMSRCNIAQFPIFTDFFAREYARVRMESSSRAVNFTVSEFIGFIGNKIVDDPMNPAYNIQTLYKTADRTSRNGEANQLQFVNGDNGKTISSDEYNRRLENLMTDPNLGNVSGSPDFVMPQVTFEMEALPSANESSKTILKIHIFDKACSPNSSLRELLDSSTDTMLSAVTAYPSDQLQAQQISDQTLTSRDSNQSLKGIITNWENIHKEIIDQAIARGLLTRDTNNENKYFFTGGPAKLKRMVMQYMPHIIYGAMGSNVKSANINSKQDPLLATINMQRSLNSDPIMPNGAQVGGVPLSVYPVDLSLTTIGCPFVRFSQEVFIDFNTNTTVDNIYYITGLTHRFEAGTYETTIKFTANDAFGKFRSFAEQINNGISHVQNISNPTPQKNPQPHRSRHNNRRRT